MPKRVESDLTSQRNVNIRFQRMNISWSCSVSALIFCWSAGMCLWTWRGRQRWEDTALAYPAPRRHRLWLDCSSDLCLCGPWSSSRSYFRGRIRAEIARNHSESCSYAPKAPKIHMTHAFQETTPNMMTFTIKWSERGNEIAITTFKAMNSTSS